MFNSKEEKREEFIKILARKWVEKYRNAKIERMEHLRDVSERHHDASVATISGSSGGHRFTMVSEGSQSESRKAKVMQEKLKHNLIRQKQKDKAERRKLVKRQQRLQKELEYLNFPSIMGWYFDGFFTRPFYLNQEYADMFNELERGVVRKQELSFSETFTEKTRRNFWPPDFLGSFFFRTRGVYMDLLECLKDPPHTPPQINFEHESHTHSTLAPLVRSTSKIKFFESEMADNGQGGLGDEVQYYDEDEEDETVPLAFRVRRKGKRYNPLSTKWYDRVQSEERQKAIKKSYFYFDDVKAEFFRKNKADKDKYYYDIKYDVWRIKRTPVMYASDYYFDLVSGAFVRKDRNRKETDYIYDPNYACYKLATQNGNPKNGLTPANHAFDEKMGRWKRINDLSKAEQDACVNDNNALRMAIKNGNANPDDFYFDTQEGAFVLKTETEEDSRKYVFDATQGVWKIRDIPSENPVNKKSPSYYYWDERNFVFKRKNSPAAFFIWDSNNKFFRLKKPLVGKYSPKNWRFNNSTKMWELQHSKIKKGYYEEDLHWRPDRDYDKPWQEYVGGYKYTPRNNSFADEVAAEEAPHIYIPTTTTSSMKQGTETITTKTTTVINPKDNLGKNTTAKPDVKGAGEKDKKGEKGGAPAPTPTEQDNMKWKKGKHVEIVEEQKDEERVLTEAEKALEIYDKYDHRVLKVGGLGFVLNEGDMRAFFVASIRVLRPKIIESDTHEDFCLVYFHTDEAALAALKTMHHRKIKGQTLNISYCKKADRAIFEQRMEGYVVGRKRERSIFLG